jgi:hypothetical protein
MTARGEEYDRRVSLHAAPPTCENRVQLDKEELIVVKDFAAVRSLQCFAAISIGAHP